MFLLICICVFLAAMALLPHPASASAEDEGSAAWKFSENNNHVRQLQESGGNPSAKGAVRIEYFAHSAFRVTSPNGLTVLFDPWRNDPSGAWGLWFPDPFPEVYADIVLSTHAHFDHDAVHRVHAAITLERPVGEFTLGDVCIVGYGDKHMYRSKGSYLWTEAFSDFGVGLPPNNPMHLDNSIIVLKTGGLRIAHWGDNRPDAPRQVLDALKGVDVIFMPIDGSEHILTREDMDRLIERFEPKVVIPCHYKAKGVVAVLSTLQSSDAWVDSRPGAIRLPGGTWEVDGEKIQTHKGQVVYFGDHHVTE